MTRDDPWLDAFDDADFEAVELAVIDAAVNRLAPPPLPTPVAPTRSRSRWAVPVAAAAAVLVGIAVGSWLRPAEPAVEPPQVVSPVLVTPPSQPLSPAPTVVPAPAPAPTSAPAPAPVAVQVERVVAPQAAVVLPAPEAPRAAALPPVPDAPIPVLQPGLITDGGARVRVIDGVATLAAGLLTYLHDATHEPGVRRVAWVDLDISAVPVGTAFRAVARPRVGAVAVSDGRVRVVHDDGTVLAELEAGDEVAAVPDLADPRGVTLLHTDGLPLDAVRAAVPDDCLCRPEDVVASVAALRLAALDDR